MVLEKTSRLDRDILIGLPECNIDFFDHPDLDPDWEEFIKSEMAIKRKQKGFAALFKMKEL